MGRTPSLIRLLRALASVALIAFCLVEAKAQPSSVAPTPAPAQTVRQKELERDAAANLSIAKKSIQEDAYYNARVALNVWKASALEAGTFDRRLYEELKRQLFDKSVKENLRCIESAVAQRDVPEANACLKIYRLHATEIGLFDVKRYEDLKARISTIRRKEK